MSNLVFHSNRKTESLGIRCRIQTVYNSNNGPRDVKNQWEVVVLSKMRTKSDARKRNTNEFQNKVNIFTTVNNLEK